jgi:NTE family protein
MFNLNVSSLFDPSSVPSLYDLDPFRKTLESLVDLSRLNEGPMRISLLAIDLETGDEVVFDNRQMVLGIDHVLASCAMLPDFPPVSINDRLLVDGGLAANTPVHLVLEPARDGLACFAVDPFPLAAAAPKRMLDAQERQADLTYACQTKRSLATYSRIWDAEARLVGKGAASGAVWHLQYHAAEDETALKGFSFGADILRRRWDTGRRDMQAVLESWGGRPPSQAGLVIRRDVR